MILTTCAACAAPLAHTAPRCIRCQTRYCNQTYKDPDATLNDFREAVTMLEETALTARRVLGSAHPLAMSIETSLRDARATLRARETPSPGSA